MFCKTCSKKYHSCSSCDTGGIEFVDEGYCSETCYQPVMDEKKAIFDTFVASLSEEQNEQFNAILDFTDYILNRLR